MKRGKKKKDNFFGKHYSLVWKYVKECKNYILFTTLLILFSTLIALFYQPSEVVEVIEKFLQNLLEKTAHLNMWQMIVFILDNNLKSSFFSMLAGFFFGVFPILAAFANGYILGFVAEKSVQVHGIWVLLRLVPHGIFELPAAILALALGIRLGFFWFSKDIKKEFLKRLQESLRVFLFIILPLLVIAAIIEGVLIFILPDF